MVDLPTLQTRNVLLLKVLSVKLKLLPLKDRSSSSGIADRNLRSLYKCTWITANDGQDWWKLSVVNSCNILSTVSTSSEPFIKNFRTRCCTLMAIKLKKKVSHWWLMAPNPVGFPNYRSQRTAFYYHWWGHQSLNSNFTFNIFIILIYC